VTAVTPVRVLAMTPSELEDLLHEVPPVARRLLAALTGRLRLADRAFADNAIAR
jgi:CRP-like cAMP-binding protein